MDKEQIAEEHRAKVINIACDFKLRDKLVHIIKQNNYKQIKIKGYKIKFQDADRDTGKRQKLEVSYLGRICILIYWSGDGEYYGPTYDTVRLGKKLKLLIDDLYKKSLIKEEKEEAKQKRKRINEIKNKFKVDDSG